MRCAVPACHRSPSRLRRTGRGSDCWLWAARARRRRYPWRAIQGARAERFGCWPVVQDARHVATDEFVSEPEDRGVAACCGARHALYKWTLACTAVCATAPSLLPSRRPAAPMEASQCPAQAVLSSSDRPVLQVGRRRRAACAPAPDARACSWRVQQCASGLLRRGAHARRWSRWPACRCGRCSGKRRRSRGTKRAGARAQPRTGRAGGAKSGTRRAGNARRARARRTAGRGRAGAARARAGGVWRDWPVE